jgi:hypothetical protein
MAKSPGAGQPFIERVELQVWWMSGLQRRSFTLESFHRALLTKADLAVGTSQIFPALGTSQ